MQSSVYTFFVRTYSAIQLLYIIKDGEKVLCTRKVSSGSQKFRRHPLCFWRRRLTFEISPPGLHSCSGLSHIQLKPCLWIVDSNLVAEAPALSVTKLVRNGV